MICGHHHPPNLDQAPVNFKLNWHYMYILFCNHSFGSGQIWDLLLLKKLTLYSCIPFPQYILPYDLLQCSNYCTFTIDLHWFTESSNATLHKPGYSQADEDIKYIATYSIGHSHIS